LYKLTCTIYWYLDIAKHSPDSSYAQEYMKDLELMFAIVQALMHMRYL